MPEQTDTWRPDAEPWEALQEADRRYDSTPEPRFARVFWEGVAGRLSGMGWRLAPAYRGEGETGAEIMADPPEWPVLEVPEGEEGRTPRRLTAVEEAIWGRYHGKHRDVGLLNKVNYLTRRVDALESAAPPPVPEGDELRAGVAEILGVDSGADLLEELRSRVESDAEVIGDLNAAVLREEGEKALRFLRELRQYLDRRLRKYGDDGDLSDYEVGCKQELEGVSTWLAEFEDEG